MRVGGDQKPCSYYSRSIAGDVCLVLATEAEAAINMQLVLLSHLHGHLSAVKLSYAEDLLRSQKLLQERCTLLDLQHMEHKGTIKCLPYQKPRKSCWTAISVTQTQLAKSVQQATEATASLSCSLS